MEAAGPNGATFSVHLPRAASPKLASPLKNLHVWNMALYLHEPGCMKTRNYQNRHGEPICPECGRLILPMDTVARIEDCVVHSYCVIVAETRTAKGEDPCEPLAA